MITRLAKEILSYITRIESYTTYLAKEILSYITRIESYTTYLAKEILRDQLREFLARTCILYT
jgi:hypothetical protein